MAMAVGSVRGATRMEQVRLAGLAADLKSRGVRGDRAPQVFVGDRGIGQEWLSSGLGMLKKQVVEKSHAERACSSWEWEAGLQE